MHHTTFIFDVNILEIYYLINKIVSLIYEKIFYLVYELLFLFLLNIF